MKKKVKSLIIAASVAAIAGIGAVSFAQWTSDAPDDATYNGTAGTIVTTAGDLSATSNLGEKSLVPWDQEVQWDADVMAHEEVITLAYDAGTDGASADLYTFTLKIESDLEIWYQRGNKTASDPNAEESAWTKYTETVDITLNEDGEAEVTLILVSDDNKDCKGEYTVTFSATPKTTVDTEEVEP